MRQAGNSLIQSTLSSVTASGNTLHTFYTGLAFMASGTYLHTSLAASQGIYRLQQTEHFLSSITLWGRVWQGRR